MSRSTDFKGHFMVVGSTGSGKTQYASAVLKAYCTGREREELLKSDNERQAKTIRENCSVWFSLKSGDAENDA